MNSKTRIWIDEVWKLYDEGKSGNEIARMLPLSRGTIQTIIRNGREVSMVKRNKYIESQRSVMWRMKDRGLSNREIAGILNISTATINQMIKEGQDYTSPEEKTELDVLKVESYVCEGCGYNVYYRPCQICRVKNVKTPKAS